MNRPKHKKGKKYISPKSWEIATGIANALKEFDPSAKWKIARLIQLVEEAKTLNVKEDVSNWLVLTNNLYQSGALIKDGSRKRTAGGCFFFIVRKELRRIDTKKRKGLPQREAWAIRKELGLLFNEYETGKKKNGQQQKLYANRSHGRGNRPAQSGRHKRSEVRPLR